MSTIKSRRQGSDCLALLRLRETTRSHHEALESALQLDHIQTDRPRYIQLVQRLQGLYRQLEPDTDASLGLSGWQSQLQQVGLVWSEREKLPHLNCDLKALGAAPLQLDAAGASALRPSSLSGALGCLYVVEGSTLGGQIIYRRLRHQLGLTPQTGLAFFAGYGPRTGAMWRQMCAALGAALTTAEQIDAAVRAAQQTFVLFHRSLAP